MTQTRTAENPPEPEKIAEKDRWGKSPKEVLDKLLQEQGVAEYATFLWGPEGEFVPLGPEEAWIELISCAAMTPDGNTRKVWLSWDKNKEAPDGVRGYYTLVFGPLWSQESQEEHRTSSEYIAARKKLNLPITEEQERILKEANT